MQTVHAPIKTSDYQVSFSPDSLKNVLTVQTMMNSLLDSLKQIDASEGVRQYQTPIGMKVVDKAREYLGCRYGAGQSGPKRFDCSGFTSFIYSKFGVRLHRSSGDQFLDGELVSDRKSILPGDIVYFNGHGRGSRIGHVGIVTEIDPATGYFYFIHAAFTGIQVDYSEDYYYKVRYMGARRILSDKN